MAPGFRRRHDPQDGNGRQLAVAASTARVDGLPRRLNTGNDRTKKTITPSHIGGSARRAGRGSGRSPKARQSPPPTPRALLRGSYVSPLAYDDYLPISCASTDAENKEVLAKWSTSTWYGTTTYYTKELKWQGQKDIHTHSIKADRPISISFIGYDEGAAQVNVTTANSLLINGDVQNVHGSTSLKASSGNISLFTQLAGGATASRMTRQADRSPDAPIRTNLTSGGGAA